MTRGLGRREGPCGRRDGDVLSSTTSLAYLLSRVRTGWDAASPNIVTRDGAVSLFPDDYGSGTDLLQATGASQPTQDSTDADFGPSGQSVIFDGTDDVLVSAGPAPSYTACTFVVIFRTGALGAARTLLLLGTQGTAGAMEIRQTASGNLLWASWDAGGAQSGKFIALAANTVYRMIGVWVPTIGTYTWTLYNSGVATGTDNGATVGVPAAQTGIARMGSNTTPAQFFNGKERIILRADIAMTPAQVAVFDAYLASLLA